MIGLDAAGLSGMRSTIAVGIALLATVLLAGSLGIFHLLWRKAVAYARSDE
jgi:hypothetical protein